MLKTIGYIGLGKMGYNMVQNLRDHDWEVIAYDKSFEIAKDLEKKSGVRAVKAIEELVSALPSPKLIWVMVPHNAVDVVLDEVLPLLTKGDIIIEGGNSPYKQSMDRALRAAEKGIIMLDCGVSGGPGGARNGACCMVGGDKETFDTYEQLFKDISVEDGYGYVGASGAGHFVKMVHNGIEYGMMQALAEGFDIMKSKSEFDLDLTDICRVYNHGSVIQSRLVGWLQEGYETYGEALESVSGSAAHSGEGMWTVEEAHELGIDVDVIQSALNFREASQDVPSYQGKLIMTMRGGFGGHDVTDGEIKA